MIDTMDTKYITRIMEMFNFYGDTITHISLSNFEDLGQVSVNMISSILNYKVVVLSIRENNEKHERCFFKGLAQDFISSWNREEDLARHLRKEIDSPTIVTRDNLDATVSSSAKRLGLDEMFLIVPLKVVIDYKEEHVGFAIAASPRSRYEPRIDLMALDTISSVITSAIIIFKVRKGLEETIIKLKEAREEIEVLKGLLPICAACKKICDDKGHWHPIEEYITDRSAVIFSHGLCPECTQKTYKYLKDLE
jgi:hypothetical protein